MCWIILLFNDTLILSKEQNSSAKASHGGDDIQTMLASHNHYLSFPTPQ